MKSDLSPERSVDAASQATVSKLAALLLCISILAGALAQFWLLWKSNIPLGVVGEWAWPRALAQFPHWAELFPAILSGGLLVVFLLWSIWSPPRRSQSMLWLGGLLVLGCVWQASLVFISPAGGGLGRSVFVMFYPRTSGYFHQALFEAEDLPQFLSGYEASIQDQSDPENYLHIGTHPPGLTSLYRLLINAFADSPEATSILLKTQPPTVIEAFEQIDQSQAKLGRRLIDSEVAALWCSIVIGFLVEVATVIPIYHLVLRKGSIQTARLIAGLWLMVPAAIIFLPKSDAFFPCLAMLLQWFWLIALERKSIVMGMLTAVTFVFAASLSLAFFTIGAILFLQWIACLLKERRALLPLISGVIVGVLILYSLNHYLQVNLLKIWLQNFQNHGVFYDHNSRTYLSWLLVNPIEATVSIGMPIAILTIAGITRTLGGWDQTNRYALFGLLICSLLWLSGKNMGEAARLWIFLMPYCLLVATSFLARLTETNSNCKRSLVLAVLLITQAAICLLTAIQIDGFGFSEL